MIYYESSKSLRRRWAQARGGEWRAEREIGRSSGGLSLYFSKVLIHGAFSSAVAGFRGPANKATGQTEWLWRECRCEVPYRARGFHTLRVWVIGHVWRVINDLGNQQHSIASVSTTMTRPRLGSRQCSAIKPTLPEKRGRERECR